MPSDDEILGEIGTRLRSLRRSRSLTLAELSMVVGVSISTLSRIEAGLRKPTLGQLLPLSRFYGLTLDALINPAGHAQRVQLPKFQRHGAVFIQLSTQPGGIQAYKMIYRAESALPEPVLRSHAGFLSLNVLSGRLRLALGDRDLVVSAGEAATFDTTTPHAMVPVDRTPIEAIMLFGAQGERPRLIARTGT